MSLSPASQAAINGVLFLEEKIKKWSPKNECEKKTLCGLRVFYGKNKMKLADLEPQIWIFLKSKNSTGSKFTSIKSLYFERK